MDFIIALAIAIILLTLVLTMTLFRVVSKFVGPRAPWLLVVLAGAALGISYWWFSSTIHLYQTTKIHPDDWSALAVLIVTAVRLIAGVLLVVGAVTMLIHALNTPARRLTPLAFIPMIALGVVNSALPYVQKMQSTLPGGTRTAPSPVPETREQAAEKGWDWAQSNNISDSNVCLLNTANLANWESRHEFVTGCEMRVRAGEPAAAAQAPRPLIVTTEEEQEDDREAGRVQTPFPAQSNAWASGSRENRVNSCRDAHRIFVHSETISSARPRLPHRPTSPHFHQRPARSRQRSSIVRL